MGLTRPAMSTGINEDPVEIKFLGTFKNHPVFQLKLNNKEIEKFLVTIKDGDNNILFQEKTAGTDISRKYQLDIEEAEFRTPGFQLVVEVASLKSKKTEVYKISTITHVIEDVVIAKL